MNKTEFVEAMAIEMDETKATAAKAVNAFLDIIQGTIVDEEKIQFPGFGTFTCTLRPARKGRNPSTGESIDIAATNQVKFKVGASLKAAVNE